VQPIVGAIAGKPKFTNSFKIGKGVITWGQFLTDVVNLVIIGAVLFAIVKGYEEVLPVATDRRHRCSHGLTLRVRGRTRDQSLSPWMRRRPDPTRFGAAAR
jgi:hypothetical protein